MGDPKTNMPLAAKRMLFVDDEPSIRLTLPPVLQQNGFDVRVASTVAEALGEINNYQFDVLLTDLNIHREGDGFLVIGAMRHVQPNCRNFILTGYPGFETALQGIQSQVDDYFVKPANIDELVEKVRDRLKEPTPRPAFQIRRLAAVLRDNQETITRNILSAMKRDRKIAALPLSDHERIDHLPKMFESTIEQLENERDSADPEMLRYALEHGKLRRKQGYDVQMLARDFQFVGEAVFDLIQSDLMPMGTVGITGDLRRFNRKMNWLLLGSLGAYSNSKTKK